ncbi:MAG: histidinol phosphate phosphatase domain-containing protein [Planctomycetota bacterium]|jgi:histidinol phosphatase-like PHP family hydrolase|nr:histidinol phosphate phosphatase domain-containing protein [Planctomycetota bacterium]
MQDFHSHTILSDGELIPAELVRRVEVVGYQVLGISDHSDLATLGLQIPAIVAAARAENRNHRVRVFAGTEITHVRPGQIAEAVRQARQLGVEYVLVHGETLAEPVLEGTNRAAIEAGVDILAHPGLISEDDTRLAAKRGVLLEISGRRGHSLTNGHVATMARKHGAKLVFGSDTHDVGDSPTRAQAERILRGAGLSEPEIGQAYQNATELAERLEKTRPPSPD